MLTKYKCTQCETEDSDNGYGGTPPLALICFQCGAGGAVQDGSRRKTIGVSEQLNYGIGMLRLQDYEHVKAAGG